MISPRLRAAEALAHVRFKDRVQHDLGVELVAKAIEEAVREALEEKRNEQQKDAPAA